MKKLTIAIAVALTACGGGGTDSTPVQAPAEIQPKYSNILALGNSLTIVPYDVDYIPGYRDWGKGGYGMAASAPEKDYVHLLAAKFGVPFIAMNLAANERFPEPPLPVFTVGPRTLAIVQLGENGIPARYSELLQRLQAAKIVCVSNYWNDDYKNSILKPQCLAAGGAWVDISGLQTPLGLYDHVGVDNHPGDVQMAEIARRILETAK